MHQHYLYGTNTFMKSKSKVEEDHKEKQSISTTIFFCIKYIKKMKKKKKIHIQKYSNRIVIHRV